MEKNSRSTKIVILVLLVLAIIFCVLYLFWGLNMKTFNYSFPRRLAKVAAFILTAAAIGVSTVIFQTVSGNRILTPAVLGLDRLYMFIQTVVVFFWGGKALTSMTDYTQFAITLTIMALFAILLFLVMFGGLDKGLFRIILIGMIFGSLFDSMNSFMQAVMDPNEFLIIQDRMFASFNNVNTSLLGISSIITIGLLVFVFVKSSQMDVLSLGRDMAINLGIPYYKLVGISMLIICILVAVSTAVIGPVSFLGIFTANISVRLLKTYKHNILFIGSALIGIIALAMGQFFVERIFTFSTTLSVIIDFAGGIYFIYLIAREGRK
jgi:ABC-type enterochelin transport system, permease component